MDRARFRPKQFPPPDFPPVKARRFSRVPPAVFPVLLGLLGLGLAWRRGLDAFGLPSGFADLLLGMAVMLWAFAVIAYLAKIAQRGGVVVEDLRVLPGRSGLAAAGMGGMAVAAAIAPIAPLVAKVLLFAALGVHALLAVLLLRLLITLPRDARPVDPGWHLAFVGFIVGGIAASALGLGGLAAGLLYATLPAALAIWTTSAVQFARNATPAPLRPLMAIHLAPAALFATVGALTGHGAIAFAALSFGALLLVAGIARLRWLTEAGFSPMWGAFTFPLAAYATALFVNGMVATGAMLLAVATVAIPVIAYRTLALWAKGSLAAKTNAAQA